MPTRVIIFRTFTHQERLPLSITKIRNQFAACGLVAGGLIAFALVLGLLIAPGTQFTGPTLEQLGPVAFKLNDIPVYQMTVDGIARRSQQALLEQRRQSALPEELSPNDIVSTYSQALETARNQAAILYLAEREKIGTSVEDVREWIPQAASEWIDEQLATVSANREIQVIFAQSQVEQLKTEKGEDSEEYKAAFQRLNEIKSMSNEQLFQTMMGVTVENAKAQMAQRLQAAMDDRSQWQLLQSDMASDKLRKKIEATIDTSDEAVRRSYDQFTFEQIYFEAKNSDDAETRAREVLNKIKAGMDFKEAMDEFSDNRPADKTKKPSDQPPQVQDRLSIQQAQTYASILDLKPGEVSDVVPLPTGAAIYRLLKVEPKVPEDFDKQKVLRAKTMKDSLAIAKQNERIEEAKKNAKIEWVSDSYRLLNEYDEIVQPTGKRYKELSSPDKKSEKVAALKQIFDSLAETTDSPELAALLRFACFNQLDALTPSGTERELLDQQRLQVYSDVANFVFSPSFKLEYVAVLIAAKNGEEALRQLYDVATNATIYDPKTFPNVERVEKLLPIVIDIAPPNAPLVKQIQSELELAKKHAEEAKRLEEEQRRKETEAQTPSTTSKGN